jgi:hypothetical protein
MCKHICFTKFDVKTDTPIIHEFVDKTHDKDGYGAIIRTLDNRLLTFKSLKLVEFYMTLGSVIKSTPIRQLVIHHRTSTNKVGYDYTHPFEYKGNYLTHNGVITVPKKYATKTENDSEILLHHLIDTDFDTKSVSGYFSCFILNDKTTTVVVDATAPMYTDGRVYCSHKLEGLKPIELKKIVHPLVGDPVTTPIEVTKTEYGRDKAYLSLGHAYSRYNNGYTDYRSQYSGWYGTSAYEDYYDQFDWEKPASVKADSKTATIRTDNVMKFLDYLTVWDERFLVEAKSSKILRKRLRRLSKQYDFTFSINEVADLVHYFTNEYAN